MNPEVVFIPSIRNFVSVSDVSGLTCFMVPTGTGNQGKPGKMGRHSPVREFCQDWKSQGILPKILEKTGKFE